MIPLLPVIGLCLTSFCIGGLLILHTLTQRAMDGWKDTLELYDELLGEYKALLAKLMQAYDHTNTAQ